MKLLKADGTETPMLPTNGKYWSLKELQIAVGGCIQILPLKYGQALVIDEEGKIKNRPLNITATKLSKEYYGINSAQYIVGDVVLTEWSMIR